METKNERDSTLSAILESPPGILMNGKKLKIIKKTGEKNACIVDENDMNINKNEKQMPPRLNMDHGFMRFIVF